MTKVYPPVSSPRLLFLSPTELIKIICLPISRVSCSYLAAVKNQWTFLTSCMLLLVLKFYHYFYYSSIFVLSYFYFAFPSSTICFSSTESLSLSVSFHFISNSYPLHANLPTVFFTSALQEC